MARAQANGIELEYDVTGPDGGEAPRLIMGLGAQMTRGLVDGIMQAVTRAKVGAA